jgi:hypothetical protein
VGEACSPHKVVKGSSWAGKEIDDAGSFFAFTIDASAMSLMIREDLFLHTEYEYTIHNYI